MATSSVLNRFIAGKKIKEEMARAQEAKKQQEIENKQVEEDFKLRRDTLQFNIKRLNVQEVQRNAEIEADKIAVEQALIDKRNEDLVGIGKDELPRIGTESILGKSAAAGAAIPGLSEEAFMGAFSPDQLTEQGVLDEVGREAIFQGESGQINIPEEDLQQTQQFRLKQAERTAELTRLDAEAKKAPERSNKVEERNFQIQMLDERAARTRETTRISQQQASDLRIQEAIRKESITGNKFADLIGPVQEEVFNLSKSFDEAALGDSEFKVALKRSMINSGVKDFPDIKRHRVYTSAVGTINTLYNKMESFLMEQYDLTPEELAELRANPNDPRLQAGPAERLGTRIEGLIDEFIGTKEAALIYNEMRGLSAFISQTTGGDKGSRLSDQDLKLAMFKLATQQLTLGSALRRTDELKDQFQNNFSTFYADISKEQRQAQIDNLELPFSASSLADQKKFSPKLLRFAKSRGIPPEEALRRTQ